MMKNNNLEELMAVLEEIRAEHFPDIPQELLESLLGIEFENQDNRANAQTKSIKLLDDYLIELMD